MPELVKPQFQAGTFVGEDPGNGIVAVVAGDGSVQVLNKWDVASGDVTYIAPAGTNGGGGTRRHLFDAEVYANSGTRGAPTYVNVRAFASITGKPTTLGGYGITDALPNNANGTTTGSITSAAFIVTGAAGTTRTTSYQTAGVNRWDSGAGSVAESGSDAGSNYLIRAYSDAGTIQSTAVLQLARASTGNATLARHWIPSSDNAFDNGISGTRWRDLNIGRNALIGGTLGVTGVVTLSSSLAIGGALSGVTTLAMGGALSGVTTLSMGGGLSGVTTLAMAGALTGATTGAFSSNVTITGTLGVTASLTASAVTNQVGAGGGNVLFIIGASAPAVDNSGRLEFRNTNVSHNWQIDNNAIVGDGLSITPSTTAGGSSYTSPIVTIKTGSVVAGSDNAYDFGAVSSGRFRDGFFGRNLAIGGTLSGVTTGAFSGTITSTNTSTGFQWNSGNDAAAIVINRTGTNNGSISWQNNGTTDWQIGQFPNSIATGRDLIIFNQAVGVAMRFDSASVNVAIGGAVSTAQPSGNGAGKWKLGKKITAAAALDAAHYVEVDVDGTLLKFLIST